MAVNIDKAWKIPALTAEAWRIALPVGVVCLSQDQPQDVGRMAWRGLTPFRFDRAQTEETVKTCSAIPPH
jgi:hypothetical protein